MEVSNGTQSFIDSVLLKAELHQIKFLISAVYLYIYLAQLTFPAVGKNHQCTFSV